MRLGSYAYVASPVLLNQPGQVLWQIHHLPNPQIACSKGDWAFCFAVSIDLCLSSLICLEENQKCTAKLLNLIVSMTFYVDDGKKVTQPDFTIISPNTAHIGHVFTGTTDIDTLRI